MKKSSLITLLCLVLLLCASTLVLTACGKCKHKDNLQWQISEATHEQHCKSCNQVVVQQAPHTWQEGKCSVCDKLQTEGIVYSLSEDGTYAIVAGYNRSISNVVIASTYQGVKVTRIGYRAFEDCTSIKSVIIPSSVTTIENNAFRDCTKLTSVTLGNSVLTIGFAAFGGCTSLTNITIPNSVTYIGEWAFSNTNLASVVIPNSVTHIGEWAFYECFDLTSVTIPDSVTIIDNYVFYKCKGLKTIVIPDSVTTIGERVFYNCTNLTIYCEAASKPSGWDGAWNESECPVIWGYKA